MIYIVVVPKNPNFNYPFSLYIDKARGKALEADGHNIMVALQSIGTDSYSAGGTFLTTYTYNGSTTFGTATDATHIKYSPIASTNTTIALELKGLTGVTYSAPGLTGIKYSASGLLTNFVYKPDGASGTKTGTFADGVFTYVYS
jgi:Tfp pilus assembly protein FimT